jgi:hypothetical protein
MGGGGGLFPSFDLGSFGADGRDSVDAGGDTSTWLRRRGSVQKYQLNMVTACQLVAFIYESKLAEIMGDPKKGDFNQTVPLLQFTKVVCSTSLLSSRLSWIKLTYFYQHCSLPSCLVAFEKIFSSSSGP